jgi:hypothetical protein
MPSQKPGIDWPTIASAMMPPSIAVPRLRAATMPSGMAKVIAISIAIRASARSSRAARSMTMSRAGMAVGERAPVSPRARPPRNDQVLDVQRAVEAERSRMRSRSPRWRGRSRRGRSGRPDICSARKVISVTADDHDAGWSRRLTA